MALKDFLEKINFNVILTKIVEDYKGALLLLFVGLTLLLFKCNNSAAVDCETRVQALNDTLRQMEAREKVFYRNLYFERRENQTLKDSLGKYQVIEQFNATTGPKQIILETKSIAQ